MRPVSGRSTTSCLLITAGSGKNEREKQFPVRLRAPFFKLIPDGETRFNAVAATCEAIRYPLLRLKMNERNHPEKPNPAFLELTEYGDFTCPRCQALQPILTATLSAFGGEVRHTFRHFPNAGHPQAVWMALAAEAARRQQQYPAMHRALFTHTAPPSPDSLLALVPDLNRELFWADMHDETLKHLVLADMEQGRAVGVVTTPTLFLGVHRLHGKLTQARLMPLIRQYINRSTAPTLSTVNACLF